MPLDTSSRRARSHRLLETVKYTLPRAWRAGPRLCLSMAAAAVISAILAPVAVVLLGLLVTSMEKLSSGQGTSVIVPWIVAAGATTLVVVICEQLIRYCKACLGDELTLSEQQRVLRHASSLSVSSLEDRETQNMLELARQEPGKSILRFCEGSLRVVTASIQVVGLLGILLWIEPVWSFLLLLFGAPGLLLKWYLSGMRHELKRNKTTTRRWTRYYARKLTEREEAPATKILGVGQLLLSRFHSSMSEIVHSNRKIYRLESIVMSLVACLSIVALVFALTKVGQKVVDGRIAVGQFVAFWMAAWRFRASMAALASSCSNVWSAQLSISNTRQFLELVHAQQSDSGATPAGLQGHIQLKGVDFSYPGARRRTVSDLSLDIPAGETVALVGPNGAGKTTLAKLLAGLYRPDEGSITVDGVPLEEYSASHLYSFMAFVFQHPTRFEATAHENIAFGDWRKLLESRDGVRKIAEAARVDEMILGLPKGYDTVLGRRFGEHDLSGGQWQKLAIARALACDPAIVILDEPTASLDVHAELALYQGIKELIRDRTTILISHRFSTVRMADRIFVMNEGRIVEEGTHDALLALRGTYYTMCQKHEAARRIQGRDDYRNIPA